MNIEQHTLRCANGLLYLAMACVLAGCAVWAIASGRFDRDWQPAAAAAGSVVALVWAGYYATLRWRVDAEGASRSVFFHTRRHAWAELQSASLSEHEHNGVASCCISLRFSGGTLELSSDLIARDDVETLRDDLRAAGMLFCEKMAENKGE